MADNEKIKKAKEKGCNFLQEFKTFIARGNVLDMAVGVIIGSAFSKIVTSLTENILMPIVGIIIGNLDFTSLAIRVNLWGRTVSIKYGIFIQNTVDFLITAFCIFLIVKTINKLFIKTKKEEEAAKSDETKLLEEIRDLLKDNKKTK